MPDELPESDAGGKCLDCKVPLFFSAAAPPKPACFVCKKCRRLYRGPKEWDAHPK